MSTKDPPSLLLPPTGRSEGGYNRPCRHERSPGKSNEVISPEILKMRAALFCIFTYLDTKTLLQAAEVCRDWRFVARHPAVWTRVLLENTRISSKVRSPLQGPRKGAPLLYGGRQLPGSSSVAFLVIVIFLMSIF